MTGGLPSSWAPAIIAVRAIVTKATIRPTSKAVFHLTLTLSRGEREQPAAGSVVREVRRANTALGCAESQRRILPAHEPGGTSNIEHPTPEHRMAA